MADDFEGTLFVTIYAAHGLPDMDDGIGAGASDPYVTLLVNDEEKCRTDVVKNSMEPGYELVTSCCGHFVF